MSVWPWIVSPWTDDFRICQIFNHFVLVSCTPFKASLFWGSLKVGMGMEDLHGRKQRTSLKFRSTLVCSNLAHGIHVGCFFRFLWRAKTELTETKRRLRSVWSQLFLLFLVRGILIFIYYSVYIAVLCFLSISYWVLQGLSLVLGAGTTIPSNSMLCCI